MRPVSQYELWGQAGGDAAKLRQLSILFFLPFTAL